MGPVTRRQFLTTTGAGLAGILATRVPPARGQQREISYLCWNNFAPASDKKLAEIGQRFAKDTGIKLKIDHISHMGPQQAKYASEVQTQAGHDMVEMRMHFPWLYEPQLVDVSDVVAGFEKQYGKAITASYEGANVKGVWHSIKAVVPSMIEREYGRVVIIGSSASIIGYPNVGHYVASKHAVLGLTKSLALETAALGITVNCVCPTGVHTGMLDNDALFAIMSPDNPTREVALPVLASLNAIPEPFLVRADRRRLEQILVNLVDNAIKFNRPGGSVRIGGSREGDRPVVWIEDTGTGIPADSLDKVFNRFYRVDKARSRDVGGTGLGLAIVKHLMRLHGGQVRLDSEPGKGSRFTLEFPPPAAS